MTNDRDADTVLRLPDGALALATVELVTHSLTPSLLHHSVRSFLFARLAARHRTAEPGRDYDPDLLFLACVLHDIGLSDKGNGMQRFEVDGADLAAGFLTDHGVPASDVDLVWEAIALHTSAGIAERRSTLCDLTRSGIGMDFGNDVSFVQDGEAAAIHRAYPRLSMVRSLVDAIVGQADGRPTKAPRYSLAGELVRERAEPPHITTMEASAGGSRWGD
jgi:hypothetical protein